MPLHAKWREPARSVPPDVKHSFQLDLRAVGSWTDRVSQPRLVSRLVWRT
jgi:hypothetical protein